MVVLGFCSVDDCLKKEHFCFDDGEDRANFFEGSKGDTLKHIIGHFSQPLSVVLDLTGLDGNYCKLVNLHDCSTNNMQTLLPQGRQPTLASN